MSLWVTGRIQSLVNAETKAVEPDQCGGLAAPLIGRLDPDPVIDINPGGQSRILLIGDHAGNAIPEALGDLGLSEEDRQRHIALDIGVMGVGERLAKRIDARFIAQAYSRLVIDCNRSPTSPDAILAVSDRTIIAGNATLDHKARVARIQAIHAPYQAAIAAALDRIGKDAVLVALHSFTPVMGGLARPWHCGVLHLGDSRFAINLLASLRAEVGLTVGDNEPYRMEGTDYTVPHHAMPRGLAYAEIEIRQDLIDNATGQAEWADRLAYLLQDTN